MARAKINRAAPPANVMSSRRRIPAFKDEDSTVAAQKCLGEEVGRDECSMFGGHRFPRWVKLRRTQCEQMSSGLPLKADIARCSRHISKVPEPEVAVVTRLPCRRETSSDVGTSMPNRCGGLGD